MTGSTPVPWRLQIYAAAVWLLAAVPIVLNLQTTTTSGSVLQGLAGNTQSGLWTAFSLVALIAVAGALPLSLTAKVKVHVHTVPTFAVTLLFSPPIATVMVVAGVFAYHLYLAAQGRREWYDVALNSGRAALQVGVASTLFHTLVPNPLWQTSGPQAVVVTGALVAAVVAYLIDELTTYSAAGLAMRQDPFHLWWSVAPAMAPQEAVLFLFGFATTYVVGDYPIFAVAMVCSLATVYYSMHLSLKLQASTFSSVEALADVVDARIYGVPGHSQRVAALAVTIARRLRMGKLDIELIRQAARVHDIGQVGIADIVMWKAGPLSLDEYAKMQEHVQKGLDMLDRFPCYQRSRALVQYHHERPDGQGYPTGLEGSEIPVSSLIIAVADAYDAMTSHRPHRPARSPESARDELLSGRGTAWYAGAVDALLDELASQGVVPAATRSVSGQVATA